MKNNWMQEQYLCKELNIVLTSSEYCLCPPRLMISPSSDILKIECVFLHLLKKIQKRSSPYYYNILWFVSRAAFGLLHPIMNYPTSQIQRYKYKYKIANTQINAKTPICVKSRLPSASSNCQLAKSTCSPHSTSNMAKHPFLWLYSPTEHSSTI